MKSALIEKGYTSCTTSVDALTRAALGDSIFRPGHAGTRCLLDVPLVASVAGEVARALIDRGILGADTVAIQAIAFDKSPLANWKVTWHQDLIFPFAQPVSTPGYVVPSKKDGVEFARPPLAVLEELLAVRLHLDDCDEDNGPLRVVSGSHAVGIIPVARIPEHVARIGASVCTAKAGDALLMRLVVLHASSKANTPRHRRVLHLVYHSGATLTEAWHRAVRVN